MERHLGGNMALKRMDNVGIVVEDLGGTIDFFRELGLELEGRATIEGEWAGRVTGLGDQSVEIAMLRTPDGHGRIELSHFLTPPVVADHRNRLCRRWLSRLRDWRSRDAVRDRGQPGGKRSRVRGRHGIVVRGASSNRRSQDVRFVDSLDKRRRRNSFFNYVRANLLGRTIVAHFLALAFFCLSVPDPY